MFARGFLAVVVVLATVSQVCGQTLAPANGNPAGGWRSVGDKADVPSAATAPSAPSLLTTFRSPTADKVAPSTPCAPLPRRSIARVTEGTGALPNTQGQVWREYDISPYTLRATATNRPEQAIVDWILRETGYQAWHGEPLGILSATKRTLRVYHTPEMQNVVADIVDRFVSSEAESRAFGLRIITLDQPNWRTRVHRLLHPVITHTPGVQAWLVQKEDAAVLLADLRRRSDFREQGAPQLLVNNGQSQNVAWTHDRSYIREVTLRAETWPGYEPDQAKVDEGFSLELTPLLSVDGRTVDAAIKCEICQLEKTIPVTIDVPAAVATRQRTQIDVPQIVRFQFHERFRWPVEHVLLVDLGMVAMPALSDNKSILPSMPLSLGGSPGRADLLVFVESQGSAIPSARIVQNPGDREASNHRGRY